MQMRFQTRHGQSAVVPKNITFALSDTQRPSITSRNPEGRQKMYRVRVGTFTTKTDHLAGKKQRPPNGCIKHRWFGQETATGVEHTCLKLIQTIVLEVMKSLKSKSVARTDSRHAFCAAAQLRDAASGFAKLPSEILAARGETRSSPF